jgi:hypothetical protein
MTEQTYTFRSRNLDGSINEVEMTENQARTLMAGRAVAWWPHDERVLVEEDGTIVFRESAVPASKP